MNFPRITALAVSLAAAAALPGPTQASLSIMSEVGGAPTGDSTWNMDVRVRLPDDIEGIRSWGSGGFAIGGGIVTGNRRDPYAPPVLSGSNGLGFGPDGTDQPTGRDTTRYLTSRTRWGSGSSGISIRFAEEQNYLGLLWGSVEADNVLSFYDGDTLVGMVTGDLVAPHATGGRSAGTYYVNITSTLAFDQVFFTSWTNAFEFDNLAWNSQAVSEPPGLALLGIALVGLGLAWRLRRPAQVA